MQGGRRQQPQVELDTGWVSGDGLRLEQKRIARGAGIATPTTAREFLREAASFAPDARALRLLSVGEGRVQILTRRDDGGPVGHVQSVIAEECMRNVVPLNVLVVIS